MTEEASHREQNEGIRRANRQLLPDDVVFEGSMARCTWELGLGVGSEAGELQQAKVVDASKTNASVSLWSRSFDALIVFPRLPRLPPKNPVPNIPLLSINPEHPLSVGFAVTQLASCRA